jgi:transposase-like protein
MEKRTRRVFTPEYKVEAVRLAKTGNGNIAATARDLGIDVTTLRDWLHRASAPEPDFPSLSPSENRNCFSSVVTSPCSEWNARS